MTAPKYYQGGTNVLPSLNGTERVPVDNGYAGNAVCTTQQIANLASAAGPGETVNTAITTVGAGTLTAAAIVGGVITRSGPVAAYTDTTDTALAIVAAIPNAFVGQSFFVNIKNTTAFPQTLAGGSGVTFGGASLIIPPNSVGLYLVTLTSLTAVSFLHIQTALLTNNTPEVVTALTTNGAGTITAAGIAGGVTARSGTSAAFTDTTDTAALIIAAQPNAHIGLSWEWTYYNNSPFAATLAGGSGVTLSGLGSGVVPANSWVRFLVTYTAANTVTIAGIQVGYNQTQGPEITTALATVGAGTITAAGIVGGVTLRSGSQSFTPFTDTTDTAANIISALPNAAIGQSFEYVYRNNTNAPATLAGGSGATVSGITVVPANSWARFLVTYTAAATVTVVGIEQGNTPAVGTFTMNGVTPVSVSNAAVTANSFIDFTLKTVGGTVGACPAIQTITPGTGFTVAGTAADTSVYNYRIAN